MIVGGGEDDAHEVESRNVIPESVTVAAITQGAVTVP
jgi:hypothetical protein